jgi:hypothetical protein
MPMNYEELDDRTRQYMLSEFEKERSGANAYHSKALSAQGQAAFTALMTEAIKVGNEASLVRALEGADLWEPEEVYTRDGVTRTRRRNVPQSATRLALTEFSTWYVRGLARRLLDEGVDKCQVYRGEQPKWEPGDCAEHEGQVVSVQSIYDGHRARYWPEPGNQGGFSIPFGPGCHHVIRRLR